MSHENALIQMRLWEWEERALYLVCCIALFSFIGFLFWRSKE